MERFQSGVNTLNGKFYVTEVTDEGNGVFSSTLFRTDAQGKNEVPIAGYGSGGGEVFQQINTSNATAAEQQLLADPNSVLNKTRQQQTKSLEGDIFGDNATPSEKKSLEKSGGGSGNTASGPGTGDGLSESAALATAISSDSERNRDISKYPGKDLLKYPIDLNPQEQDFISFTMLKYSPKKYADLSTFGETGKIGGRDSQETRRGSTVVLPIQPSISDTNTVDWNSDSMDAFSLVAASGALNTISEGAEGAEKSVSGITGLIGKGNSDITTVAAAKFAEAATGTKGLLTRVTGGIVNPNMELLFNGPQLRNFQFSFTLSAREPKESKNIRNIIRFFKQGMSVKRSTTDLFLQSPHTFEIKYIYALTQKDHPWINRIKECALTGCTVNYTPAGNYATFGDGAMTSYEIGLQFSELEAIYDDDYKNSGGKGNESEIGY